MNWAEEVARDLIAKHPKLELFTVASGISPSGYIHIGNFREIVTTYFVAHELEKLGKKVRFIVSIDNYDRFRKVPIGMPSSLEECIGRPYTDIPSPFGTDKSYAMEMQDIFISELNSMGITPEYIFQTDEYKSGRYIKEIKIAMSKRKKIFDILAKYKTQEFTDSDRDNYYPISVYCESCGKDSTRITDYRENGLLSYACSCGRECHTSIDEARNIKLAWKIDWPMRWMVENVVFEPGGRDHSAANGSYVIGKEIAKEIYDYTAPDYVAYDFIGIKGGHGKMSSSNGTVLTLGDLLKVYDKYLILWFYAKYKPSAQFDIALDNDVIRYYSEFDRFVKGYFEDQLDEKNHSIISITGVSKDYLTNPSFNYLATFLPMVNYNEELLKNLLRKENIDCDNLNFNVRLNLAKHWIENYGSDYQVKLLSEPNKEFYDNLSDLEKKWIKMTIDILSSDYSASDDLQTALYAVVKGDVENPEELKQVQKKYFQTLYNLLLGLDKGPKLGLLLLALPKKELIRMLDFKK